MRLLPQTKTVGLVSAGHFFSHFYLLLLPPLFPLLREQFNVGFTQLGFALTTYSIATALTQIPAGFIVDRYGARRLLIFGLLLESAAIAGIGVFGSFNAFIVMLLFAGIANSVFHPADYSILSRTVEESKMGRAFSVHTFAGFIGEALAPAIILSLMLWMHWRMALVVCGIGGAAVGLMMIINGKLLDHTTENTMQPRSGSGKIGLKLLVSLPIVMGLLFFMGISLTGRGITGFGASAITELFETPVATAGVVLSCYLFAVPFGVLIGGRIADRTTHHGRFAALCFLVMATTMFMAAAFSLSLTAIGGLFIVAGLFSGMVAPSRDMLIRSVTPPDQMGKVFAFVSTGFNIGGIFGPPLFGYILDNHAPQSLFWIVGAAALMTMATVLFTEKSRQLLLRS